MVSKHFQLFQIFLFHLLLFFIHCLSSQFPLKKIFSAQSNAFSILNKRTFQKSTIITQRHNSNFTSITHFLCGGLTQHIFSCYYHHCYHYSAQCMTLQTLNVLYSIFFYYYFLILHIYQAPVNGHVKITKRNLFVSFLFDFLSNLDL